MNMTASLFNLNIDITSTTVLPIVVGLLVVLFFVYYIKVVQPKRCTTQWIDDELETRTFTLLSKRFPMNSKDIAPLVIITVVFLFLAVFNLGSTNHVDVLAEIDEVAIERAEGRFVPRSHMDSLYFDEIFFVRTAAEHIQNLNPFENTHPPLGKLLISASISTIGESPFGWRLFGAISGVIMLVIMYLLLKNMFGKTIVATCGTLLLGFDFMRFVQTRLGTVDTFTVLFIFISFYFMYRYITTDRDAPFSKSLLPLALSGIFFGLSFAVKWTGFYAGAGLLIIYVVRLWQLGMHYKNTKKSGFAEYLTKTLMFSMLFFVIIPVIVYYLSYIPYGTARGMSLAGGMLFSADFFNLVWSNQVHMFMYHSYYVLGAEHPFSSTWWQWILNIRPILYVRGHSGELQAVFGAFGNPVVWWGGFLAIIAMIVKVFTHRDGKAFFILVGYFAQLLPWVAVTRILFIYHYFPSSLFIVIALAHMFNTIKERREGSGTAIICGFTGLAGAVFLMFYPMISGIYMPAWYFNNFIRWFTTWPF